MFAMGTFYEKGIGVTENIYEAFQWFDKAKEKATELGDAEILKYLNERNRGDIVDNAVDYLVEKARKIWDWFTK